MLDYTLGVVVRAHVLRLDACMYVSLYIYLFISVNNKDNLFIRDICMLFCFPLKNECFQIRNQIVKRKKNSFI